MIASQKPPDCTSAEGSRLSELIQKKEAKIGICGMGYVGLPLSIAVWEANFSVIAFDIDPKKVARLLAGDSYLKHIATDKLKTISASTTFDATSNFARLAECDVIVVCVPTPIGSHGEPDLSFVNATFDEIAVRLRPGQLIVLESTTYPGTTRELVDAKFTPRGLKLDQDYFVAFSPEREDPGNKDFSTKQVPKVVGGVGPHAGVLAGLFYSAVVEKVVPVSSADVAEAVKITENVFRAINIALVNELKVIFSAMDIDIWDVIEAAKTKPFGYMPFYPGPGLGGHCIPIDPFYLTWRAREFGVRTRFIELAGEINSAMPKYVVESAARNLDQKLGKALGRSAVLLIGLAYKPNVDDIRESPAFEILEILEARGAKVDYHDPWVPQVPETREYRSLLGRTSVLLNEEVLRAYDLVIIVTDHDSIDFGLVASCSRLIVDTRNALAKREIVSDVVVKA